MKDHAILRSLTALIASLPATENKAFRDEFETVRSVHDVPRLLFIYIQEYEDVQITAFLSSLTKSASILNDVRFF